MKEIFSRRSVRRYLDKPVEDEKIKKILRAAMYAPSAGNEQPWHFVIVKDKKKLHEITSFHPYTQMLKEAPLGIVVCGDTSNLKHDGDFWIQDMSASIQNMLLQAEALGIGTCWCGLYPKEQFIERISKLVNLPQHIIPVAIVAVGYPAEKREVGERYKPERVHYENW